MNPLPDTSTLLPGDVMLYFTEDFVDRVIAEKTGAKVSHIEIYADNSQSLASRNGIGVNIYPVRMDGLVCVRRPLDAVNLDAGMDWFNSFAKGQPYDFAGLFTSTGLTRSGTPGRMFCSEFAINFHRACGWNPINKDMPAACVYPRDYWVCGRLMTTWRQDETY